MNIIEELWNIWLEECQGLTKNEKRLAILFAIAVGLVYPFKVSVVAFYRHHHPSPPIIHVNEIATETITNSDEESLDETDGVNIVDNNADTTEIYIDNDDIILIDVPQM